MRLGAVLRGFLSRFGRSEQTLPAPTRGPVTHVVILDGTMSSLREGRETNAGLLYKLVSETAPSARVSVRYEAGVQWQSWRTTMDVIEGRGINRQIRRMYGVLASRYRQGDRIFLFGYSRGAFAVRSLAGVIDQVGLLRREHATERAVRVAWRHYERGGDSPAAARFRTLFCHAAAPIEMVGVWDTVKALSLRLPLVWHLRERRTRFHSPALGASVKHGFHALALDETRDAFKPVLWQCDPGWAGHVEQVWFRGNHGDIGGQLNGDLDSRPLSNIPLVWMLGRAEACGLTLPNGWRARFPTDVTAPSVSTYKRWGKLFLLRSRRVVGRDPTERLHPTAERIVRQGIRARVATLMAAMPGARRPG
ncbi:MAG: DUF2235 domain-containing protein [Pseudomonadota bacterium]